MRRGGRHERSAGIRHLRARAIEAGFDAPLACRPAAYLELVAARDAAAEASGLPELAAATVTVTAASLPRSGCPPAVRRVGLLDEAGLHPCTGAIEAAEDSWDQPRSTA